MRTKLLILMMAAMAVIFSGCATGFRAGGRNAGVEAGAAFGPPPAPSATEEPPVTLPPPQ